ncbi:unnamed protein product, partial [Closterium sp. NIES-54]
MAAISSIAAAAMAASSAPMAALTRTVMSSPLASSMLPIANSLPSAGLSAAHAPQQLQCQDRASNVGRRSVATPAKSTWVALQISWTYRNLSRRFYRGPGVS